MPIDASIYQNARPNPVQMPSPFETAEQGMRLSQLGMQVQSQQAMRQAYANSVRPDGSVDQQAVLSNMAKLAPYAVPQLAQQMAAQNKAQAEARSAQYDAAEKAYTVTGPVFDNMAGMSEENRERVWPNMLQHLKDQGVDVSRMDHPYDAQSFKQYYSNWQQSKPYLEKQLKLSEINKNNMDPLKVGAEELGKFNEDVNNPTTRKTTGGLKDMINRADRIMALANAGAKPGETPEQRTARLNKVMPQIAKEYNLSLAYLMQGGVPTEGLSKELGTDTAESAIAKLKQQFTGSPEGANQGEMIQQYVDTAKHLRNFASQRLDDITDRAKSAYPYAKKYFGKEMDKIGAPIVAPASGAGPEKGDTLLANNASEKGASNQKYDAALQWLKNPKTDPTSPQAFKVRAILKARGLL